MSAADVRRMVLSHLDAMLSDPLCEVILNRDSVITPDVIDRYVLGKLTIIVRTPTFTLEVKENQ